MTTFRDHVQLWADGALTSRVPVKLYFHIHGGEREAYANARKVVIAFASLRAWMDKKERKRCNVSGDFYKGSQYSDVSCTIDKHDDHYEVVFMTGLSRRFAEMYQVEGLSLDDTAKIFRTSVSEVGTEAFGKVRKFDPLEGLSDDDLESLG